MAIITGAVAFAASGAFSASAGGAIVSGRVSFAAAAELTAAAPPKGRRRRVVVTDVNGTTYGELENAVLSPIVYELGKIDEDWSFQILQNDPKAALILDVPFREVQVWRGDQILAWGPAVRPTATKETLTVSCHGAGWHLGRRHIGKADRHNWVSNGSFEDGLAGWDLFTDPVNIYYGHPEAQTQLPDASTVSFPTVLGKRALAMSNHVNGAYAGIGQQFEFTVDSAFSPEGDTFTLKGYAFLTEKIDGNAAWNAWGLYLERFSTTEPSPVPEILAVLPDAKLSLQQSIVTMDEDFPVGVWTRLETEFTLPPKAGEPETIYARLFAPANQTVYWDAISLTLVEKLPFYGVDQALICQGIVEHLQDAAYDKSDVNISTSCPATGVLRNRVYIHSEHPNGLRSLEEFPTLDNGLDWAVTYTPTDRIFTTYYPRRGTLKSQFALTIGTPGAPGNVADWSWTFDGEAASNSVIVLGTGGSGSSREEGSAVDTSAFEGGLTLEEVYVAPPESTIDSLDDLAVEHLAVARNPVVLEVKTIPGQFWASDPVGRLWPGDDVPVTIQRHSLDVDAVYRVVKLAINPDDTLDLTLNLRAS